MTKKKTYTVALWLVLLAIVGVAIWGFLEYRKTEEREAAPVETEKPVVYMSTNGVVDNIERRLTANGGRAVEAACPDKVDETVGTTFTCEVTYEGSDEVVAVAAVEIDGPMGEFSWTSESANPSEPEETPAP